MREPVGEVTASTAGGRDARTRVVVGTEAVLHQVPTADVVAFLDFDQELLAPRYRAAEQALALLARAARLLGGRARGRPPRRADPPAPTTRWSQAALLRRPRPGERRRAGGAAGASGFPPFVGHGRGVRRGRADAFMEAFGTPLGVDVLGPSDDRGCSGAGPPALLCDALAATPRPSGPTAGRGRPAAT